jgi:5'-nucleotidase / UDP-sugar diphosphatase
MPEPSPGETIMLRILRRFSLVMLVAIAAAASATTAFAQKLSLTILHINDVYEISPVDGKGGFAPLMTLLKAERARNPNNVFTFGGDLLSPSIMSGLTKGSQMIDMTNAVGVDVAVYGNHEFDFGPELVAQRVKESKYPWVSTNVLDKDGKPFGGAVLTLTKKVGDFTIGFMGLLTAETTHLSSPGASVVFRPVEEAAAAAVKQLRDGGANVIVALTHLDLVDDRALARNVRGIDVIMGGHDHDPMAIYEGSTIIFKAGHDAHYLGVVDLAIERGTQPNAPVRVTPMSWKYLTTIGVAPDPEIDALVKKHNSALDAELLQPIGKTATALDSRRTTVRGVEAAIGNLIADAMLDGLPGDVAITNGGGIRADKQYEAGTTLTRKDVFAELPFGNLVVMLELKGSDLLAALENGVSQVENVQGRFPQVSGLKMTYDLTKPPGSRVLSVSIKGAPLDANKLYKVVTNDFMAAGGDGFSAFTKGKMIIDASGGILMATKVMNYIAAKGTVSPTVEGRMVVQR